MNPLRRLWPRRNNLMRPSDWLEAALLVFVITVALVMLPIAAALGSETYANQLRAAQDQALSHHQAIATLTADAPNVDGLPAVPARWTLPNGTPRTGLIPAPAGTRAGQPVPIWLDPTGTPAPEPPTHETAALAGLAVAMGLWITTLAALSALFVLARLLLNRHRLTSWHRAWLRTAPTWTPHP
jgi:hypothetical protein